MKILMIAPTPFFAHRGTHIRILEEALALERRGHSVKIVTYHVGDDIHKYIDTHIDVRRIRRWLFWYKKTEVGGGGDWQKILLDFFLVRKTFYMIRTWKPDVVHAHLHEGALIGWLMKKIFFWRKNILIADFHGSLVNEMLSHGYFSRGLLKRFFSFVEWWINGIGDAAVISSEENVSVVKNARSDEKAYHIYDGVALPYYDKSTVPQKNTLRKKYNIPQDAFVVVYTGALIENKGVGKLLEAMPALIKKHKDIHFLIGGYPAQWVQDFVEKHHIKKFVSIISPLNYFILSHVNMSADIAIDPKDNALRQASGKILQYMAAGLTVVCSNRPTNRAYIGQEGFFVEEITAHSIVDAVSVLYQKRAFLDKKILVIQKRAQNFSWDKVGEKLEEIYQQEHVT